VLLWPVLANWVVPTFGGSFVLAVGTESLAVLSATVAAAQHAQWLAVAALVPFVLGLAFYVFVIRRFDFRQLLVGRGDQWITGGALAISTLAIARITLAADSLHTLTGAVGTLEELTVVLWVLSIAWIPVLVIAEVARPRPGYDVRRWATVFPIGMYAACSGLGGSAAHAAAMTDFARVLVWIALAVWLVVFVAMVRHGVQLVRGDRR
jgi:tellurite resistance protein TehA-like permease